MFWRLSNVFGADSEPVKTSSQETQQSASQASQWVVQDRSIDEARPLRVVVIGAGISGILACIRFAQRIPNIELCIYEKNADIGGTWFENRYPGCACGECSRNEAPCSYLHCWNTLTDKARVM
jgi:heterodisulfide reductase subunit A-like polyferredoxin